MRDRGLLVPVALALALPLATPPAAQAQAIPKDQYLRYVPLEYRKAISQTEASAAFHLYGDPADPGYRDEAPRDGMDDGRLRYLRTLGVRFAPLLVRNTPLFPVSFKHWWKGQSYPLYLDTWDIARARPALVKEEQINFASLGRAASPTPEGAPPEPTAETGTQSVGRDGADDCRLLALLRELRPGAPRNERLTKALLHPEQELFTVLYFDFPGKTEEEWKKEYWPSGDEKKARALEGAERIYTHPLVAEVRGSEGTLTGYEFAIQYWFFYPENDGGNNHMGDWEHINVIVQPRSTVERPLTAEEVARLVAGQIPAEGPDPLVLRRVEYYFHKEMMILDYSLPNAYAPRAEWEAQCHRMGEAMSGEQWIRDRIRERAWQDRGETRINSHPVAFIGGDGLGLAQLFARPGGADQDSHGTYPFTGIYKAVGPTNAGEQIARHFDHRDYGEGARPLPDDVEDYAKEDRIEIIPDWERVADLVFSDPGVRREYAWMLLPIRYGYPAVASPGAGLISNADTGNLSVVGPTFNEGWNRLGPCNSYRLYRPHRLTWALPLDLVDNFHPRYGFLNAPAALVISLPPFDLLWRVAALPARAAVSSKDPVFYPGVELPRRFMSFEGGVTIQKPVDEFSSLFLSRDQLPEILARLAQTDPNVNGGSALSVPVQDSFVMWTATVSLHLGRLFTSENSLAHGRGLSGFDISLTNRNAPFEVRGDLNLWEYQGVLRYNLLKGGFRPYLKAGYGLTWYRLENVTTDGALLSIPESPWIRKPGLFHNLSPSTLVTGLGVEMDGFRIGNLRVGGKAAYTVARHRVGFEETAAFSVRDEINGVDVSTGLAESIAGQRVWVWRPQFSFLVGVSY
jgi:hypothetical protein